MLTWNSGYKFSKSRNKGTEAKFTLSCSVYSKVILSATRLIISMKSKFDNPLIVVSHEWRKLTDNGDFRCQPGGIEPNP